MDLNKPAEFTSSCIQSPELLEFMPMPPPIAFPSNLRNKEPVLSDQAKDDGKAKDSPFEQAMKQNLEEFWSQQMTDIKNIQEFKNKDRLPLARIRKIMKADKEVKMISADTPILFSKACELFILELTLRSWLQADGSNRRTIHRSDISSAIRQDELLQFLAGSIPAIPAEQKAVLDEEKTVIPKEEAFDQFLQEPVPNENAPPLDSTLVYHPSPSPFDVPVGCPISFDADAPIYSPMPFGANASVYRPVPFDADVPFNHVKAAGNVKFPEEIQVNNPNKLPFPLFDMNQTQFLQNQEIGQQSETKPSMLSPDFGFLYCPAPKRTHKN